jgi:hypothetical protein
MILRRISENIRSQNWFAVAVEFIIVVVGVFMGLQVQDWNEVRKERIEEHVLLLRLYEETLGLIEVQREELKGLNERASVLMGVNPVLYSQEPSRIISDEECANISASHVYRRPPDELPVLDEMLETGRFDLLQSQALKDKLRNYVMLRERARAYYGEAVNELFRLHSRFPSLITIRRLPVSSDSNGSWGGLSWCLNRRRRDGWRRCGRRQRGSSGVDQF